MHIIQNKGYTHSHYIILYLLYKRRQCYSCEYEREKENRFHSGTW
jgi:hypothetical protein